MLNLYAVELNCLLSFVAMDVDSKTDSTEKKAGPFSLLKESVAASTPVLINLRNNKKLLGHVRAYDRHFNMVLENVQEIWTEGGIQGKGQKKAQAVTKDRFISKMFLRGDSVILVLKNPLADK